MTLIVQKIKSIFNLSLFDSVQKSLNDLVYCDIKITLDVTRHSYLESPYMRANSCHVNTLVTH